MKTKYTHNPFVKSALVSMLFFPWSVMADTYVQISTDTDDTGAVYEENHHLMITAPVYHADHLTVSGGLINVYHAREFSISNSTLTYRNTNGYYQNKFTGIQEKFEMSGTTINAWTGNGYIVMLDGIWGEDATANISGSTINIYSSNTTVHAIGNSSDKVLNVRDTKVLAYNSTVGVSALYAQSGMIKAEGMTIQLSGITPPGYWDKALGATVLVRGTGSVLLKNSTIRAASNDQLVGFTDQAAGFCRA